MAGRPRSPLPREGSSLSVLTPEIVMPATPVLSPHRQQKPWKKLPYRSLPETHNIYHHAAGRTGDCRSTLTPPARMMMPEPPLYFDFEVLHAAMRVKTSVFGMWPTTQPVRRIMSGAWMVLTNRGRELLQQVVSDFFNDIWFRTERAFICEWRASRRLGCPVSPV